MPFLIRYPIGAGHNVAVLTPAPSDIDYPEKRLVNVKVSRDSAVVLQRPLRDDRVRKWIWEGYRGYMPVYAAQWELLESLEAKALTERGLVSTVEIWENVTGIGGFNVLTSGVNPNLVTYANLKWTKVKIIQSNRLLRKGAPVPTYDVSEISFVIMDPDYTGF
jgi:hypothetical protein